MLLFVFVFFWFSVIFRQCSAAPSMLNAQMRSHANQAFECVSNKCEREREMWGAALSVRLVFFHLFTTWDRRSLWFPISFSLRLFGVLYCIVCILFSLLLRPNVFDWRAFCYCCNSVVRCVLCVRERIVSLCYQSQRVLPSERLRAMPHWYTGTRALPLLHTQHLIMEIKIELDFSCWTTTKSVRSVYLDSVCRSRSAANFCFKKEKEKTERESVRTAHCYWNFEKLNNRVFFFLNNKLSIPRFTFEKKKRKIEKKIKI